MATKAATSKARAQTAKTRKGATSGSGFIITTPDTYLNSEGSTSSSRTTCKKAKHN